MSKYVDECILNRFTKRITDEHSINRLGFINTSESHWAGSVEIRVSIFRPGIGPTEIGSYVYGGVFVISGDVLDDSMSVIRASDNVSGDYSISLYADAGFDNALVIELTDSNFYPCSAVCNINFKNSYGVVVKEMIPTPPH